jgi:membrane associated rhomboid family serine protease
MPTCYRHPGRETGVSCSNCGNPICPDCMTPTPVGMRCPDCSRQKTPVRTLRSLTVDPIATYVLIAINVAVFFAASSSLRVEADLVLFDYRTYLGGEHGVAEGEWWRLITSGFVHTEFWHLGLNMLALYWLGRMIEPALGHARFLAIYFASLLTGALGVMLLDPEAATRGASGAIYGLLGAAIVMARNRQINLWQSGLIPILAINLAFTFLFSSAGISLGGHLGGLIGGLVVTWVVEELAKRRRNSTVPAVAFCVFVSLAAAAWSIATVS